MGIEIFDDPVGQRIKALLINYALYKDPTRSIKSIEASVDKTHQIVAFTRQACIDALSAEADVLCFRQVTGEPIPIDFVSGILHSAQVISGKDSIIGT